MNMCVCDALKQESHKKQALGCLLRHSTLNSQPRKPNFPKALVALLARGGHGKVLLPCRHLL